MKFWIVDTFTKTPFTGTPAAVIIAPHCGHHQQIASELNVSKTIFVVPKEDSHFEIRWFSPLKELRICGHGTLAAAHVLWNEGGADKSKPLFFESRSGILKTTYSNQGITIDFPAQFIEKVPLLEALITALNVLPVYVGFSQDTYFVEVHSPADIMEIDPDITALTSLEGRGVIVTADSPKPYDFVSRFFEPQGGMSEDAASAYAYAILAPYWAKRLGKTEFFAHHLSNRGGEAHVLYRDERVYVTGNAVITCEGNLRV